ncbi:MAG: peptidylprolyl isomerase, partial [Bacteroidales bacterium]|nr:peptidylprolyl isomerase [Bacteroidales bacterium]
SYTIPAEFVPEYYHKKGALAAARRGDAANPKKASHGSQFYLVQDEFNCLQLDGEYTVFGETVQGLEVIDRIAAVPTDAQDRPLKNVKILSITLSEDQTLTADSPNPFEDYDFDDEEDEIDEAAANAAVAQEQPQEQSAEVQAVADTVEVQTEMQAEPQTEAQVSEEQAGPQTETQLTEEQAEPQQEPEQQTAPADTTAKPKPADD